MSSTPHNYEQTMAEPKMNIQILLSKSYSVYFFTFITALLFDIFIKFNFKSNTFGAIGLILIILSSLLIYWAQTVNKKPAYNPDGTRDFTLGPYKYSRNPTQTGLFIMMVGAGFVMGSFLVLASAVAAVMYSTFVIIPQEESRHIKKYGAVYTNYMKRVRRII